MILASAQTSPKRDDIPSNLADHYHLIDLASKNGASLVVFPEMSITGYERERAMSLAFTVQDPRLNELKKMSVDRQIIVIAGAPILIEDNLYIGAFIIKPDDTVTIYTKQFLHTGEDQYFKYSLGNNPAIELHNERITLAICADIDNPLHAENAFNAATTIYLASIFFTPNGIPNAYETLSGYAGKYSMNVLMANFAGRSWDTDSGGQSAFWDKQGKLIASLDDTDAGLLLMEKNNDKWSGKTIKYK